MREQLNGPICVLCAAMNLEGTIDRQAESAGDLFQATVAVLAAIGFVALFIL